MTEAPAPIDKRARAIATTVLLWAFFVGAFVAGYWIVFVFAAMVRGRRGIAWGLGHYAGVFFGLVRLLVPGLRIVVPEPGELRQLRGCVIVCNHLSFLDPVLLLSLLPTLVTIVRPDFFRVPIFGWLLRGAGFLGPDLFAEGRAWVGRVERHLRQGGNLLIFPEGTRSRDGRLGEFKKGAFYLAKLLASPIHVFHVAGTGRLFAPGRLTFDVTAGQTIEVRTLASIDAAQAADATTQELTERVRTMLEQAA